LKLYQEGRDDEEDEENRRLPQLRQGENVNVHDVKADQHFTEPPPRYSEASLVKKLEELGIGRPSTYAAILERLRERNYVRMDKNRFIPDDRGRLVIAFLENFFRKYVEYDFTADLEEKLDEVSAGELDWKALMRDFWKDFSGAIEDVGELRITEVLDTLNEVLGPHIFPPREDGSDPRRCQVCGTGTLSLRLGKYGAFVGCSNYPDCKYTRPLVSAENGESTIPAEGVELGESPEGPVLLKTGRFGPYVEMPNGDADKPKRASLPRGWSPDDLTLEKALKLLSLPREVGVHPSENELILAGIGRYGPYLQMGKLYANLPSVEDVFEIQMNRAVAVIDEKKAGGGRGRFGRAAPTAIKDLGESPVTGKPVRVLNGRYGPYINDGETNANVPKDKKPEDVTLDEALSLLAARAEAGGGKKKGKKAAPKKAAKPAGADVEKEPKSAKKAGRAPRKSALKKAAPRRGSSGSS
jgi:DNA topoisomerase-1